MPCPHPKNMPSAVLIDTNVLLAVAEGFDLFGELEAHYPELELLVMEGTLRELKTLQGRGKGKEKAAARLAEQLVIRQDLNIVPQSDHHVDTALLTAANERDAWIATVDRELQKRAKAQGIPVLTIRKRRLLRPLS